MAASIAENMPSNMIESDADNSPNSTPNSETATVTPIEILRSRCSAAASGMRDHIPLPGRGERSTPGQIGKIRQVVVLWARSLPWASVMRPSAVPTLEPTLITLPSACTGPVSAVMART